MQSVVSVNPFRCRMWALHDRLESEINEETCRTEIESFSRHGQLVPALGRALQGESDFDVELVYGARRLFVARHINRPLQVELRNLSDREAIILMDIENRQRKDVSPYERGLSYARWMRAGYFRSQDDIARALKVSSSQVSRLLKLARLPAVVVDAFGCSGDICEGWGVDLVTALDDPHRRQSVVHKARTISRSSPRPPARDVYRQMLAASTPGRRPKVSPHDEVIKDDNGMPLFRIRHQSSSIAVLLPLEKVSSRTLENIRTLVAGILQHGNVQVTVFADSKHMPDGRDAAHGRRHITYGM